MLPRILILTSAAFLAGRAPAQPAQPPAPPAEVSLPVDAVFRDMAKAYQASPAADRITISVREPERVAQQAAITIKLAYEQPAAATTPADPTITTPPATPPPAPPKLLLASIELGQLRIFIRARELTATLMNNPTSYFQTTLTPATDDVDDLPEPLNLAITRVMGPVPLATLALAEFTLGQPAPILSPYTPSISWSSATTLLDTPGAPITLTGQSTHGPARFTIDGRTLRPITFTTVISAAGTKLEMQFAPREPGDPAKWPIETAGRTRVDSLAHLARRFDPPAPTPTPTPAPNTPSAQPAP